MKKAVFIMLALLVFKIQAQDSTVVYSRAGLQIKKLGDDIYLHISNLLIPNYGLFPCNGIVYINNGEAVVLDTPVNDSLSSLLLDWLEKDRHVKVIALIANHFHNDCTGGLQAFHRRSITSYSHKFSCILATERNYPCAMQLFTDSLVLNIGRSKVISTYHGEAHSRDNIVTYFPGKELLFGGCMIKETGAGKGNLTDANLKEWSATVERVALAYPDAKVIVPGHGKAGNRELLYYTIALFRQ